MIRAVLSIGANLGDARAALRRVADAFADVTVARSAVYSTPPWGGVEQGDFLNAVLIVETDRTPLELLRFGQSLENAAGRVREVRWGPRTLDVDVVQVVPLDDAPASPTPDREVVDGEIVSADPVLTLPHPHARDRAFVLVPWLDADPGARLGGEAVADLVAKLDADDVAAVRRDSRGWGP
ncbi:2-amino-4-hydroxy-6-hydroxymethyldihydropteridine diphosphokinase [Corynebacterium freneyi]|uniref:2-amino-4-hydroxy-6- hydroxymethyldihydropteridine diphosphokinase n=1 Tax=Corynebacterium freneyi TaxID=134034 RepID=UPI001EF22CF2|nr:2-amino-4-hydroxy-6-hydroxymethyldihydropteridine diphosphokinase [Corynebacterium freneyi]MCG7439499.1 2-amino-4-hydroxy-6-hydroxymethyldihydropteridine diphosphokinase [Corynebacterium freneyi]